MRYKDDIQCAGAELVRAIREDSLRVLPQHQGEYYALHIRRGDFQFKVGSAEGVDAINSFVSQEVKLSAAEILKNLHMPDGSAIIPPGT